MNLFDEGTKEIEYRIAELHKLHKGQLPEDAEFNYLEHARKLPLFGIYTFRTIVSDLIKVLEGQRSGQEDTLQRRRPLSKKKNFISRIRMKRN